MADNKVEIEIIATGLEETKKRIEELTSQLNKLADNADNAQKRMKLLGEIQKQFTILTATVGGFGAVATKMALDFNKSFGTVQTLIGTNAEKTKRYKQDILDLSNTYGKSAKDLSDGMYQIVSAFGESTENAKQLEIATKGAVAGGATAIESINLLSAVTKGYGDTSAEALQKVSDLSFQVVKDGQTTFPELAGSIGRVVPTASALGISMEELMAVFSTSTGVIGGASEVSTKFQAGLVGLTKPTKELSGIYAQLGVASGDALIKQKGFVGALNEIKKVADANGQSIDKYFGSVEAGNIALALTGNLSDQFAQKLENMNGALGATDQAYKDFTEGSNALAFNMEKAGVNLQNFGIKIGEELIPKINTALSSVFGFVEGLSQMDKETVALIVDIGEVLAVVAGMTVAVTTAQKAWLALTVATKAQTISTVALAVAQKGLNAVMAINPFGLAVIGLTALVALLVKATKWTNESAKAWGKQNSELGKINSKVEEAKKANEGLATSLSKLLKDENNSAEAKKKVRERIDDLLKKYPNLTEEIIRNAEANNALNEVLAIQEELKGLEEQREAVKKLGDEFVKLGSKSENISFEKILREVDALGDDDLLGRVIESFTKGTDWDRDVSKELAERLSTDVADAYKEIYPLAKKKLGSEVGFWGALGDLVTGGLAGNYKKIAEKFKEDATFLAKTSSESIDESIGMLNDKLKTLGSKDPVVVPDLVDTEGAIAVTDKEFNALKKAIKKNISDLEKELKAVDKELAKLKKPFDGELFTPVSVGDDPWGMQKVLDLTGELAVEISNQVQRVADAIDKSSKILKLEQEKAQLEEKLAFEDENLAILEKAGDEKAKAFAEVTAKQKEALEKGAREIAKADVSGAGNALESIGDMATGVSEATKEEVDKLTDDAKKEIEQASREIAKISAQLAGALASSAMDIFKGFSEADAKKYLDQLDALEQDVNERLAEYQAQRQAEEERIAQEKREREEAEAEEKRQREYEQALQDLDRTIGNLEAQFNASVSAKKRAEIAEQIEEANKKKAEERKKREEEIEEKKRQKEEEKAEKERQDAEKQRLYEFELEKYKIEVDRIKKENEMAESDKKQRIAQVWIDTATGIATAWASSATPATFWFGGVFSALMAGIAGAQTAMIAGQNVQKPTPSAPKPPKFRQGGIIPNQGQQGMEAIVGDGVSEAILPLEEKTYQALADSILKRMREQSSEMRANQTEIQNMNILNNINLTQNIEVNYAPNALMGSDMPEEAVEEIARLAFREGVNNLNLKTEVEDFFMKNSRYAYNAVKDQT